MQESTIEILHFEYLPAYARFILEKKLEAYMTIQSELSKELNLPILKFYQKVPEAALQEYAVKINTRFLQYLIENNATEQLKAGLMEWENNQLEFVKKEQVQIDDLLLISHLRKKAFVKLLPAYTQDSGHMLQLVLELDRLFLASDRSTTHVYVQLLKNKISEDLYFREKLAGTSPGFYYIYDIRNDKQVQPSFKLFSSLGYSQMEYDNEEDFFTKIVHPGDLAAAVPYLERVKKSADGEVNFFEYRLRTKNETYRWMRNYESIYKRDDQGEATQLIGVAFDISKERAINDELRCREEELLEAQELTNMGSYNWDIKTGIIHNTEQTNKILGVKGEQTLEALLQIIHPADRAQVSAGIKKALSGSGEFEAEYRCTAEGKEKIIWGKGKVTFDNGLPISMKGTVMDVTDKHHMVQKLTRSEHLYKQAELLNKLGNWTWEIKKDKLEWSDELYRIYGLEPQSEKVNFERFVSFIHPDDKEDRIKKLEDQMQNHQLQEYYFRIIAADGREKILFGQSRVLADEAGVPFKFVGTCQDVTKQKELENTLFQKTIQLERSNASLQDFAFISSHDLKEPLRKISVFGDKLRILQQDNLPPESNFAINKIVDAAKKMQQMVDELLSLSRISTEQNFQEQNLQLIVQEAIQMLEDKIGESNAEIHFSALPDAYVNKVQFRQLFGNLLSNALKFSREGVRPVINISHQCPDKNEINTLRLDTTKKYIRINVTDNGIGFENVYAEKIFTIFQRLHRTEYEGTGIGLALCKKIVEQHNGVIYASAKEGAGATFSIVIPAG